MEWSTIIALVLAIPVVLIPVAFIWYLNVGGIVAVLMGARERKAAREKGTSPKASHAEVKH